MTWKTAFVVIGTAATAFFFNAGVANAQASDAQVKRGQTLWQVRGCAGCHSIGKGAGTGIAPDLEGVTQRRSVEWLHAWLKDTAGMLASDSTAIGMMNEYSGARMPNQKISEADTDAILAFIKATEAKKK
jgi:mono/diheme cytochrome c family protein